MTTDGRQNPCKGRYAGCTADCDEGAHCENCRLERNRREAARRAARKAAGQCVVCGKRVVVVDGEALTTCKTHREYYRARDEAARNAS